MDTAQEIRNGLLNREEGISLVKKYDGEFPKKYFEEILDYLDLSEKQFWSTINKFRSSHLWTKKNSNWKLKKTIYD